MKTSAASRLVQRLFTYDRDIICFPRSFETPSGLIPIPRQQSKREFLAHNYLIGKIHLTSALSEDEIIDLYSRFQ